MSGQAAARRDHWQTIYATKPAAEVSWYQASPQPSLQAIARSGAGVDAGLIDVGGGASLLVDALLERQWSDLTVLDVSAAALEVARQRLAGSRLGNRAARVAWIVADITAWQPERTYDVWHDRAVFHFLTDPDDRRAYQRALAAGLVPGGHLIIATFAADGPERCSGLPVQRYSPAALAAELGTRYDLVESWSEDHRTPAGGVQRFNWCRFVAAATVTGESPP